MKLVKENLKKNSPYVWKKDIIVLLYSMGFFVLNSKRESKYYIFDIIYNIALIYFYWEITQNFYDFRFVIIFFDFFLKFAFYRGIIGNLKTLLYLPISLRQKKIILFCLPLISLTNIASISILFYNEYIIFLFSIINSYFIFNLKTNRSEIIHFVFFYILSSFVFFYFLNGEDSLSIFFTIMTIFILLTIKKLDSYLKFN
ncbi:hypothetical protein CHRY9393_03397 [Chryseobacterium fistulae]|uniref:Uncharacterized protein n=1 Tax=Chryseobacterium fistulae TaxID=2675058 RepID=A0A6N4XT64_9FLAO|nr:hypothetical protein CHRY9393_03397 [Chryseobacterium fistulae]